jgi:hypothetical protein
MDLCPFVVEKLRVLRHQKFRFPDVAIGDCSDDLDSLASGQLDLYNRTCFGDVHVRWRVIEGVDANLEPAFSNEGGHNDATEGLRLLQLAGAT